MKVDGHRQAPAPLQPGKTRYPLCRRLGGPQGRSCRVEYFAFTVIRCPDRPVRSESLYRLNCLANVRCKVNGDGN